MNFEELLDARESASLRKTRIPIGMFGKIRVEEGQKTDDDRPSPTYMNTVEIDARLNENIAFCNGLRAECEHNGSLTHPGQLHLVMGKVRGDQPPVLQVEQGTYLPLDRLLADNPAIVAQPGFIDGLVRELLDVLDYLHKQNIWHVCFAPSTIFVRKGDHRLKLLSHGSFYLNMNDQKELYDGFADYVAPEVLAHGTIDERCDIYGAGRLIEYLFSATDIPVEYKRVVKKATKDKPEDRYQTPADMFSAIGFIRKVRHTMLMGAMALMAALLLVGLYFEFMPQTKPVEFVKPASDAGQVEDMLDKGFNPETELGTAPIDTIGQLTAEQMAQQREYEAKMEEIFRKRFTKEADRILSKIYNKDFMGANERKFMAASTEVTEELASVQMELAGETHLSDERSQMIATEIVEKLSNEKKAGLNFNGIQK